VVGGYTSAYRTGEGKRCNRRHSLRYASRVFRPKQSDPSTRPLQLLAVSTTKLLSIDLRYYRQ
jgi:hypothetical protein